MTLLDHKNNTAKLSLLAIAFGILLMTHLANQNAEAKGSNQSTAQHQPTPQITAPKSMAYFNPETGSFARGQKLQEQNTQALSGQVAQVAPLYFKSNSMTSETNQSLESSAKAPAEFEQFNNAFVVPAPRSLHTKLVAHKPMTTRSSTQKILFEHQAGDQPNGNHAGHTH